MSYFNERESEIYDAWRKAVYERDEYTCQKCGKTRSDGIKLNAHHKEKFKNNLELRFDISNGVTLCEDCHYEEDFGDDKNGGVHPAIQYKKQKRYYSYKPRIIWKNHYRT
jgi:5-methylcytosine-specific restriction endonuclease McrA